MYIISRMRYRKPKEHRATLGQFFTPPGIASLLASGLTRAPTTLLELGAGEGALVSAVLERHPAASATLVELDRRLVSGLRRTFPEHSVHASDVLSRLGKLPLLPAYSAVIGNPPYGEFAVGSHDQAALRSLFPGCDRGGWIRQDLAFLHESWRRVVRGGEMALLLASPIISDPAFRDVRRWLFAEADYISVSELPEDTFAGAEVGTHLLTVRHRGRRRRTEVVHVDRYLGDGRYQGRIDLNIDTAIERADYRYHHIRQSAGNAWDAAPTLASLGAEVIRGSRSHREFSAAGVVHLHTCDFAESSSHLRLGRCQESNVRLAERGDILVPRVGSRCLLRQAMVVSGTRPITEAVYRIRVGKPDRARVFDALAGDSGRLWRTAHARGSCAKFLTVQDVLRLPIVP